MARTPASSRTRPSKRSQRLSQRGAPAEAPTQVQKNAAQAKRKSATQPTPQSRSKRSKPAAAKKSAGRNVPQPVQEDEPEEIEEEEPEQVEEEEPEVDQDDGSPAPTQQQLEAAMKILSDERVNQKWVGRALERHFEDIRANTREEEDRDSEEPTFVKHHKTWEKPRKKKVPWTEDEEAFLVQIVAEQGPKWSHFEREYGHTHLFGRDQTAIKDKARNIMRKIIDQDGEEEFIARCPKWSQVTVGSSRRGVHGYSPGKIPKRKTKQYMDMVD